MYHRRMRGRIGIVVGVVLIVFGVLAMLVWSSMDLAKVTGEVCITYRGRTECRVASGASREEAIRTAADMACSVLASGMSDRITCENSEPTRVTWQD